MPESKQEHLPPNYKRLDFALRSIGYTFESAVADIVDNSIDAQASNILVRLIVNPDGVLDLAIVDDGHGMETDTLREAMRFGADVNKEVKRLGKFGLGMKLASLSQARKFYVTSIWKGVPSGRAWLESGIASGFNSTVLDDSECMRLMNEYCPDQRRLKRSGTIVLWSHLYRVGQDHADSEEHAQRLMRRLNNHLSLAFHRFLSGGARRIAIEIDVFDRKSRKPGIPIHVDGLDPFGYAKSGNERFPVKLCLGDGYNERLHMIAHIWPPNSDAPNYKLPGGANARQGFYFYRNNRLIQAGGWNGIRESESHSSLARVEINLGSDFDLDLSLDVKKVEIQLPPALVKSIQKAKSPSGTDFKKFLSVAEETYRTRKARQSELPMIPSSGLPAGLRNFLHKELRIKATSKHRDLKIQWSGLGVDSFFEIDRDEGCLHINKKYRRQLLYGTQPSSSDIPVVKCLLFLLLQDALLSERMGAKMRDRIDQVNRILLQAIKHEGKLR